MIHAGIQNECLGGIYQYLIDRNVLVNLYNKYIKVLKFNIIIRCYDNLVYVTIYYYNEVSHTCNDIAVFDITNPDSLQAIYECIVSTCLKEISV